MSRYIDAEYCEDFFDRWESRVKNADPVTIDVVQNTRTLLRDAPSIDIVRCKECKHGEYRKEYDDYECHASGCGLVYDADFYCADGERSKR